MAHVNHGAEKFGAFILGIMIMFIIMMFFIPIPLETECLTRFEYAETQADTLSILQEYQSCERYHEWSQEVT